MRKGVKPSSAIHSDYANNTYYAYDTNNDAPEWCSGSEF